jgi:class 3 adenylate cyclase
MERIRFLTERLPNVRVIDEEGTPVTPFGVAEETFLAELKRLASDATPPPADRVLTTVLFTDIVDSTARAADLGDRAWADLIERHHALVRGELARCRGKEIDTAGDGFFATFDGPGRAIRCARAIIATVEPLGIQVRAGVHTGECEIAARKVVGVAVVVGARVAALAAPRQVLVTSTVKDLVAGSDVTFEPSGVSELKGLGEWSLYVVAD